MPFSLDHPISYYGALSAAMSACLYLFGSTAREIRSLRKCVDHGSALNEKEADRSGARIASLETTLGEWVGRTRDIEDTVAGLSAVRRSQMITKGVDANQRTQVLRLARRGDRPEQIAAELNVPKNEVDLLLKVQRAVIRAF